MLTRSSSFSRGRVVLAALAGAGFLAAIGALGASSLSHSSFHRRVSLLDIDPSSWLCKVGLDPVNLTAAGVASNEVAGLVSDASTYIGDHSAALDAAEARLQTAQGEFDRLDQLVVSGHSNEQDRTAYAAAITELAAARTGLNSARDSLFAAATANLNNAKRDALATLRQNAKREVPVQYRLTERSNQQWATLRNALANQRISARYEVSADPTLATVCSNANAENATSAAAINLTNNLAAVKSAWATATAPH